MISYELFLIITISYILSVCFIYCCITFIFDKIVLSSHRSYTNGDIIISRTLSLFWPFTLIFLLMCLILVIILIMPLGLCQLWFGKLWLDKNYEKDQAS